MHGIKRALMLETNPHNRREIRAIIIRFNPSMETVPTITDIYEGVPTVVQDWFKRWVTSEEEFGSPVRYAIAHGQQSRPEEWIEPDALTVWEAAEAMLYIHPIEPPQKRFANDLVEAYMGVYEDKLPEATRREMAMEMIALASPRQRLETYLQWNGILGFTDRIWNISQGEYLVG